MKSAPAQMTPQARKLADEYERWAAPQRQLGVWTTPFFVWATEVKK